MAYSKRTAGRLQAIIRQFGIFVISGVMALAATSLAGTSEYAQAEQLDMRSLHLGDPAPGVTTSHTFSFGFGSPSASVGSIVFEYCTSPLIEIACSAPAGLDASAATLSQQSGETGFTLQSGQTNRLVLTRVPAPSANNPSQYGFANAVNPTGSPAAFYVRITTYPTTDGSGAYTDFGAVASSTSQGVQLSTEVPPILKFCVGLTLEDDCTTADDSVVDLGDLSTARAASGTSQMIAATNAQFGLAIAVYGTTMTSGNNVIPALASPTVSAPGNAQFGFNLRANTNPGAGREPSGRGVTNTANAYSTPNRYTFSSGSVVATSPSATDTRKFTSTYVVNISPNQPPGIYTSTLTYICTATF